MHPWLARLRHDVLKPALWLARDLRDTGTRPGPADLAALRRALASVPDDDGRLVPATERFRGLRSESPCPAADLDAFQRTLLAADAAVRGTDPRAALDAVLTLEAAFDRLVAAPHPRG